MSVNKIYLQGLEELKDLFKRDPRFFRDKMIKADVLIGSNESIDYVNKIINQDETNTAV